MVCAAALMLVFANQQVLNVCRAILLKFTKQQILAVRRSITAKLQEHLPCIFLAFVAGFASLLNIFRKILRLLSLDLRCFGTFAGVLPGVCRYFRAFVEHLPGDFLAFVAGLANLWNICQGITRRLSLLCGWVRASAFARRPAEALKA